MFAKEYFVTEKGEIIRMAAIVAQDTAIIDQLKEQEEKTINPFGKKSNRAMKECKFFISTICVPNTAVNEEIDGNTGKKTDFKYVVFHCLDEHQQERMTRKTQFCVVGDYLCHRDRNARTIWVTQLKTEDQDFIPVSTINRAQVDVSQNILHDESYQMYVARPLFLQEIVGKRDIGHIQLTEVPKAYFSTQKSISASKMTFFSNLLQVTERSNGIIFDLDSLDEIGAIENLD